MLGFLTAPIKKVKNWVAKRNLNKFLHTITIENVDSLEGYDFEMLVCVLMENCGFKCKQTPKSKDYGADVLATKEGITLALQTKLYYGHTVGNKAVQEAYSAKTYFNAQVGVVVTNSTFTKNAINSAQKLNVMLWDRQVFKTLLKQTPKQNSQYIDIMIYENLKGKLND